MAICCASIEKVIQPEKYKVEPTGFTSGLEEDGEEMEGNQNSFFKMQLGESCAFQAGKS